MSKVIDAACYIVETVNDTGGKQVTNMSINKLLYFAQGLSLLKTGKPIFDENIEAWEFGPVIAKIYKKFKTFKDNPIPTQRYNIDTLSDDEQNILLETIARYGKYSPSELVTLTHAEKTPWKNVYDPAVKHKVIPQNEIKNYFASNVRKTIYDPKKAYNATVDEQGRLVLPQEVARAWGV